jgi:hypothetical protein
VWGVGILRRVQRVSSRWRGVSESASQQVSGGLKRTRVLLFAGEEWWWRIDANRAWARDVEEMETIWGWGLSHVGNREGTVVI